MGEEEGEVLGAEALESQLEALQTASQEATDLRKRAELAEGEERDLLLPQVQDADARYWLALQEMAALLAQAKPASIDEGSFKQAKTQVSARLATEEKRLFEQLDTNKKELFSMGSLLAKATVEERTKLLSDRNALFERAPVLLNALDAQIKAREKLGDQVKAAVDGFKKRLGDTAHLVGAALRDVTQQIDRLKPAADGILTPELDAQQAALNEQRSLMAGLQKKILALMDEREMDTSQHRQDLIRSTGELSEDILDADVAKGLLTTMKNDAISKITENAPSIAFKMISFVVIILLFMGLARLARFLAHRAVRNAPQISSLASEFFVKSMGRAVLFGGFIVAAAQIGIEVGPLLAGLGIAGFVLGFALQNTLSNFASGMMILIYRPFDVGDVIEAGGVSGTVNAMNLVSTAIVTFDNQMLVVPNGKIWGDVIRNVTHQANRRVDLVFGIGYSDDIAHTEKVLADILRKNELVLAEPEPVIRLHELADSSVNFVVRPWVKTEDYWAAYWGITREVKMRFDAEGISIPFPQRDVHMHGVGVERNVPESRTAPIKAEGAE